MSGAGAPDQTARRLRATCGSPSSPRSWHEQVMDGLLAGAAARPAATTASTAPTVVRVPGTFELPVVAAALAAQGYDAVVALGVVIRGGTPHFDYVCNAATDGLTRVALDHRRRRSASACSPATTEEQALDRAGLEGSQRGQGLRGDRRRAASPPAPCGPSRGPDASGRRVGDAVGWSTVKTFEELWAELTEKAQTRPDGSGTVRAARRRRACDRQEAGRGGRRVLDGRRARGQGRAPPRRSASCSTTPRC